MYIRMGITIFKFFIWGGISSHKLSEIMFYDRMSDDIPPQMKKKKKMNISIPYINFCIDIYANSCLTVFSIGPKAVFKQRNPCSNNEFHVPFKQGFSSKSLVNAT